MVHALMIVQTKLRTGVVGQLAVSIQCMRRLYSGAITETLFHRHVLIAETTQQMAVADFVTAHLGRVEFTRLGYVEV